MKFKHIVSLILALVVIMGVFSSCKKVVGNSNDTKHTVDTTSTSDTQSEIDTQSESKVVSESDLSKVCGTSPKYSVEQAMIAYYAYDKAMYCSQKYGGMDFSPYLPVFAKEAQEQLGKMIIMASKAKDDGIKLSDEEQSSIDSIGDIVDAQAQLYGQTANEYLEAVYAKGITVDVIKKCMEIEQYAIKYQNILLENTEFTDADLVDYRDSHPESFKKVDLLSVFFAAQYGEEASDDEKTQALTEALSEAQKFYDAVKDIDSFKKEVIDRAVNDAEKAAEEEGKEFERADDSEYLAYAVQEGYAYTADNAVSLWAFDESRKTGDISIIQTDTGYYVCCVTKPQYYDDYALVTVRHILIATENHDDDETAKKLADDVYNEYLAGEHTEEAFAELAVKYSDDTGSINDGGLYSDVYKGLTVKAFNDWCFDASRKTGDTGIVKTEYGYHVMYFVGTGNIKWKSDALSGLQAKAVDNEIERLSPDYKVKYDDELVNSIFG